MWPFTRSKPDPLLDAYEQGATNLLGFFMDGTEANRTSAVNAFWMVSEKAASEAGFEHLDDVLASKDRRPLEAALSYAKFGQLSRGKAKNESEWLLGQSYGAVALMCAYAIDPNGVKRGGILEMCVDFYATTKTARSS